MMKLRIDEGTSFVRLIDAVYQICIMSVLIVLKSV